jgi:hypothetical protein
MEKKLEKSSRSDETAGFSLSQRFALAFIGAALYLLILIIGRTLRYEVIGDENARNAGDAPIYAFWHENIFGSTYYFRNRGIVAISSRSFDGEYLARVLKRLGYATARGSSSKGAASVLGVMIRASKRGESVTFAVDGPRGPAREAKLGTCLIAKKSGRRVLPLTVEPKGFWTVGSWDKLRVPKPFSAALLIYGEPIAVDADAGDAQIEAARSTLQNTLLALSEAGDEWRSA